MAESAGRYCSLCGEAAGLVDRFCRRCGESLQVPAPGAQAAIARLADEEPPPGEERPKRRGVVSTPPVSPTAHEAGRANGNAGM
jgi:hypothetical protein